MSGDGGDVAVRRQRPDRRGFPEDFRAVDGRLQVIGTGERFRPEDLVILREYHRFEGISDPDDMAIVYGIETADGVRGR